MGNAGTVYSFPFRCAERRSLAKATGCEIDILSPHFPAFPRISVRISHLTTYSGPPAYHQQNLRDWDSAGGYDKDILTHGDWTLNSASNFSYYGILGQYNYRNAPLLPSRSMGASWGNYGGSATNLTPSTNRLITIPYTKPKVKSSAGCPAFKTPKALKGRALVMDCCDKNGSDPPNGAASAAYKLTTTETGFGADAHIDGYNVFYGDYSTKWYSDQEQRVIYWEVPDYLGWMTYGYTKDGMAGYNDGYGSWCGLGKTAHMAVTKFAGNGSYPANVYMGNALLWNTLDRAAGIDLVDQRTYFSAPTAGQN